MKSRKCDRQPLKTIKVRGAADGIKPGVERSGTPGFMLTPASRVQVRSQNRIWPDPDFLILVRPVLVSLQRLPFRAFTAEEFLGRTLTIGAGGCVSVFQGSSLTLGQMADACVYVGGGTNVDSKAKPTQ